MEWTPTATLLLLGLALLVAIGAVRRVYLSPLSRFPGPPSAALTLWNEFYWDVVKRGTFIWRIQDMHERYGPIVRINPYEVHVNDPDFFEDLYVSNRKLDKYRWWTNTAGADGSSFSTVPHDLHRRRRAALNPFFSARAVTQLEPLLRAKVEKLSSRFEGIAASGEVVRLDAAFMALTMDIICDYAFARDRRYLDEPDFMLLWKKTLLGAFENGATSRQFPWLLPLMKSLPLPVVSALHPGVGHLFWWQRSVKEQIRPILDGTPASEKEGGARTIFHTLRDSDLPDEEKTLDRFCDEGEILTGAGSETTAQATTRLMFYLKHEPETLVKLREELDAAVPNAAEIPSWMELQKLPYLSAAIKEATRMSGGVTTRLPRVCHEDIRYKDYIIPAGTPVSMTTYLVLMNPSVFPDPHRFRPERWLEAAAEGRNLDKYFVPFGKGTRQCPGMNLAHAEMFLAATMMVRRFDWDMYETGLGDVVCKHDHFVAVGDLDSKGVRATLRLRN